MANKKRPVRKSRPKVNPKNFQDEAMISEKMKGRREDKYCGDIIKSTSNDPQWYFKDEQVLRDVATFSFNQPLGSKLHFYDYRIPSTTVGNTIATSTVPGLLEMRIGLTPGVANDAQDPINLAATNLYSFVRYKNSGAANYDAPDLMMYMLAMDSIYTIWNWEKRIYGFASTYSQRNRYMPVAYMRANGVDFEDIMENLADFRAFLNIKANEIKSFCVPATMTYLVRHSWLFSNIFKDSNTAKAQQYMYTPEWVYTYDETTSTSGGVLKPIAVLNEYNPETATTMPFNFKALKTLLNNLLENVNYSEDIGIMSGDILKAYGEGNLFTLSNVTEDYKIEPVYSEEVLTQIENAEVVSLGVDDLDNFIITQDPNTNFVKCQPYISANVPRAGGFINFHWENPTPQQVIVASRLKPALTVVSAVSPYKTNFTSMGSEVAVAAYIHVFAPTGDWSSATAVTDQLTLRSVAIPFTGSMYYITPVGNEESVCKYLSVISMLIAFDWAPSMNIQYFNGTKFMCVGTTRDYDNYVLLNNYDLDSMNLLAILTEFNIPN